MGHLDDMTDPSIDVPNEDPTDPSVREEGTPPTGFREEPTVAAGTRTIELKTKAPWLTAPDPSPRERPRDPLFWPVVVFVMVLVACIGITLLRPSHRASASQPEFSP